MELIVDTREQLPLFKTNCVRWGMLVGDYTTRNLFYSCAIERKSLQDLCGTITHGHLRFQKEILRAAINNIELILVVEGTKKNFVAKKFPRGDERKIDGSTLGKIIDKISIKYKLKVYWCRSRTSARKKIIELLTLREESLKTLNNNSTKVSNNKTNNRKNNHLKR